MKVFFVLILLVATACLAFVAGREVGRQDAASPVLSPDTVVADSLILASEATVPEHCGTRGGVQRWAVKTLSDVDRDAVVPRPVDTTIEALAALARPARVPSDRRVPPHETTIYRVRGYLTAWNEQDDGDLHLVLFGLEDQTVSLIAEIPNPDCQSACRSGYAGRYAAAREALLAALRQLAERAEETVVLEVTGVGFFDHNHGQIGAAPNFFELHPVLALRIVH